MKFRNGTISYPCSKMSGVNKHRTLELKVNLFHKINKETNGLLASIQIIIVLYIVNYLYSLTCTVVYTTA